ncbi:MAG TPA: Ig-like domain-containing protein [Gemmatimonadales bacterium]|nr:Ig-like domain-containing protein [Gemmatimonadales bacterium]
MSRAGRAVAVLMLVGFAARAQSGSPLKKTDLIRLLTSNALSKDEMAGVVRRNCLSFRPTARDRSDLAAMGADAAFFRAIDGCLGRRGRGSVPAAAPAPAPAPTRGLVATLSASRLLAHAGGNATLTVQLRRDAAPDSGARVVLKGSAQIQGGPGFDLTAVTDRAGNATFTLPAGRLASLYHLQLGTDSGEPISGATGVDLVVSPGGAAGASVQPSRIDVHPGREEVRQVTVALRDSLGNPIGGETIALVPQSPVAGWRPTSAPTDPRGMARFSLSSAPFRANAVLEIVAGGRAVGTLPVVLAIPADAAHSAWSASGQRAAVGERLAAPLLFTVRDSGGAALGLVPVTFTATNARVDTATVITDTGGRAAIGVTFGAQPVPAVITASVGSVTLPDTIFPAAAAPTHLALTCGGQTIAGLLILSAGKPAALGVRALDPFEKAVAVEAVQVSSADERVLKVGAVTTDAGGALVPLDPRDGGTTLLTVTVGGLSATVTASVLTDSVPGVTPCS